jgi:hypothetical protein
MKISVVTRMMRSELPKANKCIYGANSSIDDDVKCDKDSVEDREVSLIAELNTSWSSKENIFPQLSHTDVETYFFLNAGHMTMKKFIRGFNLYRENYIHDISFFFKLLIKTLSTLKHIFFWICSIFVQVTPNVYFHNTNEHVT